MYDAQTFLRTMIRLASASLGLVAALARNEATPPFLDDPTTSPDSGSTRCSRRSLPSSHPSCWVSPQLELAARPLSTARRKANPPAASSWSDSRRGVGECYGSSLATRPLA